MESSRGGGGLNANKHPLALATLFLTPTVDSERDEDLPRLVWSDNNLDQRTSCARAARHRSSELAASRLRRVRQSRLMRWRRPEATFRCSSRHPSVFAGDRRRAPQGTLTLIHIPQARSMDHQISSRTDPILEPSGNVCHRNKLMLQTLLV